MSVIFAAVILTGIIPEIAPARAPVGFLYLPDRKADGSPTVRIVPYHPRPGDMVMYDDGSRVWRLLYGLAGTEPPDHSGIVVPGPAGEPMLLESGPDNGTTVCMLDVQRRFEAFQGTIWVRQIKTPIGPEARAALAKFAQGQVGKRYATGRLLAQGTLFRARGPLLTKYIAKTYPDRCSWLCSELVVAAGTSAGLFNPEIHRANTLYPRDLIDNHVFDFSATWEDAGVWSAVAARP